MGFNKVEFFGGKETRKLKRKKKKARRIDLYRDRNTCANVIVMRKWILFLF